MTLSPVPCSLFIFVLRHRELEAGVSTPLSMSFQMAKKRTLLLASFSTTSEMCFAWKDRSMHKIVSVPVSPIQGLMNTAKFELAGCGRRRSLCFAGSQVVSGRTQRPSSQGSNRAVHLQEAEHFEAKNPCHTPSMCPSWSAVSHIFHVGAVVRVLECAAESEHDKFGVLAASVLCSVRRNTAAKQRGVALELLTEHKTFVKEAGACICGENTGAFSFAG